MPVINGEVWREDHVRLNVRLEHAVTAYDIKQSKRRGYNPNALAHYLGAVTRTMNSVRNGVPVQEALKTEFCDRLLTVCLKAC